MVIRKPPQYFVTDVKVLENRGEYFRLEFCGGTGPVIVDMLPGAYRELARRVAISQPALDCRLVS